MAAAACWRHQSWTRRCLQSSDIKHVAVLGLQLQTLFAGSAAVAEAAPGEAGSGSPALATDTNGRAVAVTASREQAPAEVGGSGSRQQEPGMGNGGRQQQQQRQRQRRQAGSSRGHAPERDKVRRMELVMLLSTRGMNSSGLLEYSCTNKVGLKVELSTSNQSIP